MNPLEQEYLSNLERAKDHERKRQRWMLIAACAIGLPVYLATELSDGPSVHAVLDIAWTLSPFALVLVIAIADRFLKRWEDRDVVAITSERERLYRDAPVTLDAQRPRRLRRWLAAAPAALLFAMYVVRRGGWLGDGVGENLVIGGMVLGAAGLGAAVKRVYETWRSRRNARLELRWDRWLESADSCKVGAREWTE